MWPAAALWVRRDGMPSVCCRYRPVFQILFWKTGVCGGFTTFSTFSLEALTLLESGRVAAGGAYMALSLGLCLGGVLLGRALGIRAAA